MNSQIIHAVRLSLVFFGFAATAACSGAPGDPSASTSEGVSIDAEQWRAAIVASPATEDGCFEATFPRLSWEKVDCVAAPNRTFWRHRSVTPESVGNGDDYAAQVSSGSISQTVGTFPTVTGVTSETDGRKNTYSIQLNSNFMSGTAACKGVSGCLSWLQYVYSSSEQAAFMQYWLIGIGTCPDGSWYSDGEGDCYKNSAAVSVARIAITELSQLKMSGTAVKGGKDTLVFTNGTKAYTTSGADTVADLATAWTASEFNVIGDGDGSEAVFNKGSSVTVKIAVTNGTTNAPECVSDDGTTGETNNLSLDSCSTAGGSSPYVEFTEKD